MKKIILKVDKNMHDTHSFAGLPYTPAYALRTKRQYCIICARYGERGAADAKPKAQIILDVLSSIWQRRCRAAAAGAVLKPQGGNCAVLPKISVGKRVNCDILNRYRIIMRPLARL